MGTSQGAFRAADTGKVEEGSSLTGFRGHMVLKTLIFELLVFMLVREGISVALSHIVCGTDISDL